jgi:anti-sigma regulatory factor (Ser/Thr protein kinase)
MADDRTASDSLRIPPEMSGVDQAESYASAFCQQHQIGPRLQRVLLLILEELVANTVNHGQPPQGSFIDVTLRSDGNHIFLYYRDRGIPFNPNTDRKDPDFSATMRSRPVGGVGWPLIFHYCAEVRYRRLGDANDLELTIPALELPES